MSAGVGRSVEARRTLLVQQVLEAIQPIEVDAPSYAESQLDMATALFACALAIAQEAIGAQGVARHLARLAKIWRLKPVANGAPSAGINMSKELH